MAPVPSDSPPTMLGLSKNGVASSVPEIPTPAHPARPSEAHDSPRRESFAFNSMEDALAAFARGEFLVVMDDEGRENEGDLIIAASECSTEKMAWMVKHSRCVHTFPSVRLLL